ncbi:MAG: asparagine synthase (glutamine-hydrolyzing) [Promethearchaeota archaeon]
MCGIIGEISKEKINTKKFIRMRDTLIHRGPDDEGVYFNTQINAALGHRRLSIIDLSSAGKQPMKNEDGTIWITYNGEIYNFQSLKSELIDLGHDFYSNTDTEVIIHGYEEWGVNVLDKLNGMFAFGIWDENKSQLFLARDRVGIKPLYYYYNDQRFIFASEIKAIVEDEDIPRIINPEALKFYFMVGYIPSPYSIWENIHKLPPGHYLILNNHKYQINKYWELKLKRKAKEEKDVITQIHKNLKESINLRFISDVPVGVLLSGGIDSSLVTAIGSTIKEDLCSYSIGFVPEKHSELKYAKLVANSLNIENKDAILSVENIDSQLDKMLYYYDEPLGVSSIFPTFRVMDMISKELKVALSGDGGDELFAGYFWHSRYLRYYRFRYFRPIFRFLHSLNLKILQMINNSLLNRISTILMKYLHLLSLDDLELFNHLSDLYFPLNDLENLFDKQFYKKMNKENFMKNYANNGLRNIKDLLKLDFHTFLVDHNLTKVDRASMAHSLELRVPFLDHNLVEYVMSIDHRLIFKNRKRKYLLKKVAKKYLPREILTRKKGGFNAPLDRLGFVNKNLSVLKNSQLVKDGILNKNYINYLLSSSFPKMSQLWILIILEKWYRKWKGNGSTS